MRKMLFNEHLIQEWNKLDPENGLVLQKEILDLFLGMSPQKYQQLKKAYKERDYTQVQFMAHSLKSDFGNVGAEHAHETVKRIEEFSRSGDYQSLDKLFMELETIAPPTFELIVNYRNKLSH